LLRLNNIKSCVCVCVCVCIPQFSLPIHPLKYTWVISVSWLLWIMIQNTWKFRYLFDRLISFPLDVYIELGLLDYMIVLFFIFEEPPSFFSIMVVLIYIPPQYSKVFISFHPTSHLHSKAINQQNEAAAYGIRGNICKPFTS
jgi:hypothetical protein